ncbi:type II toxin-antitoxin system PemI/MazE family antitoxin [Enterococcus sp. LJL98]
MLTTRSRKNGNSIVVTLPISSTGVKQKADKEYIVIYGEDDTITLIPKLEDPFAQAETDAYYQEDVWEDMPATGKEIL